MRDIQSFELLFRNYHAPLVLYAYSITGRRDVAEEVVQDVFYKLWRDRNKLVVLSMKNYLYGAVRNQALQQNEYRQVRELHKERVVATHEEGGGANPHDELELKELERIIERTLQRLPERRRLIFDLHRNRGLKYKEIAERLSLSVKTIEAEMTKAYRTLRREIEKI